MTRTGRASVAAPAALPLPLRVLVPLLASLVFSLTGCSASGGSAPAGSLLDENLDTRVAGFYHQRLSWAECGDAVRCSAVTVPLDWNDPGAATITIALAKRAARGPKLGSLLVNPGGPGESGVSLVADSTDAVDATVQKHFDVIGFDPRGVGKSSAITCFSAQEKDAYLYDVAPGTVGSEQWITAKLVAARAYAGACARNTGPLIAHVDSVSAAKDLDVIRAVLGEKKLNYLGYSYGSFLGTIYAGLFPHRVGRLVFDGIDNPWAGSADPTSDDASAPAVTTDATGADPADSDPADLAPADSDPLDSDPFEQALRAFLRSCLAGESTAVETTKCAFTGSTDAAMTAVAKTLAATSESPLRNGDGRLLGGATLYAAVTNELYSVNLWPALNQIFRDVAAGDPATAFASADAGNGRNSDGSYLNNSSDAFRAIGCLDGTMSNDATSMRQDAAALAKTSPVFGLYQAYGAIDCASWSVAPIPALKPVTAAGSDPILLIGTTNDPATPYVNAEALAAQLANAHLVTYTGEGHTAYNTGSSCVDSAVDRYFLFGEVPDADPQC